MSVQGHLIKLLLAASAVTGLIAVGQCRDMASLRAEIVTQRGCVSALVMPAAGSTEKCEPALVKLVQDGRRLRACDAALSDGNLSPSCSAPVQQLAVDRAALAEQLARLQADSSAAILRAETRARQSEQRKTQNARIVAASPVDGDGLIVCDAQCLRARIGSGPGT